MSASTSPIPYTGNKSCIVKTILDVMPQHDTCDLQCIEHKSYPSFVMGGMT